ncbi:MAG: oligosaccharide flippase family protein [Alicyclobacillus herbarius]|uniref:lipopolysaccharide biosynthesis protein n=1 Tax=Alicyclobacillus herbarius TaxID=122960 RepID=UPI002357E573|nr:oligosaccharide flippase family protein [Alicyclobacillus herbarius]MCL6631852.1 oligosaccharide flippase family protein [Alicyclobacillus herbarius]
MRETTLLVGGTALAQGMAILATPLLTRVYGPADFGVYATYTSLLSILAVPVCLRYEQAIVLPEDDVESLRVLVISLLAALGFSLLVLALTGWFGGSLSRRLHAPTLGNRLWLLAVALAATGLYRALSAWASRQARFLAVARTKVTQVLGQCAIQVGLGAATHSITGLLIGDVVGRAGGSTSLAMGLCRRSVWQGLSWRELGRTARRYARFPLVSTWASLCNALSLQLPPLLMEGLFNPTVAGWYSLSYRVLAAPLTLIGQAVGQVFYTRAARLTDDNSQLARLTSGVAVYLLAAGMPLFTWLAVAGGQVFTLVFGSHWSTSGVYASWLCPWFLVWMVSNPLSNLLFIRNWQGLNLAVTLGELTTRVASVWVASVWASPVWAMRLLSGAGVGVAVLSLCLFLQAARASLVQVLARMCLVLMTALPFVPLYLVARAFPMPGFWLLSVVGIGLHYVALGLLLFWQSGKRWGWGA